MGWLIRRIGRRDDKSVVRAAWLLIDRHRVLRNGTQLRRTEAYATNASPGQIAVPRQWELFGERSCMSGEV